MGLPTRAPRQPAPGGRALLLLGVLLALAAGGLVIYIVSQYTGGGGQTETVWVATQTIPTGDTLVAGTPTSGTQVQISQAFSSESIGVNAVPSDAFLANSITALNTTFDKQTVVRDFKKGDILLNPDPHLSTNGAAGSLIYVNPSQLVGKVIVLVQVNQPPALVTGDSVDILVTECNLTANSGCVTQTTLTNVYVYDVSGTSIYLALSNQDALALKYLVETGNVTFAIRPTGDTFGTGTGTPITTPVNSTYIINNFNFK